MKLPEIIGIAGTNGAGKDTLADARRDTEGAHKVGLSDILRVEATRRGLTHERENLRAISAEWASKMGAGALALMTIQEYMEGSIDARTGLSIVSVRRPAEARAIQDHDGLVIWIDGDSRKRYERVQAAMRGRVDDLVTFEEFCRQENIEMYPGSDDPSVVNMAGVREVADIHIENSFAEEEDYKRFLKNMFELNTRA